MVFDTSNLQSSLFTNASPIWSAVAPLLKIFFGVLIAFFVISWLIRIIRQWAEKTNQERMESREIEYNIKKQIFTPIEKAMVEKMISSFEDTENTKKDFEKMADLKVGIANLIKQKKQFYGK